MSTLTLSRVLLSTPSVLATPPAAGTRRSWIQLARCGSFVSNRYGKFSITKTDLSQMVENYRDVTPKHPTELPVDYDHLSMDPKKPGDGIAAGWMKQLQLREDGDELWGEIEWTPDAAERIHNREYRFVSPSFVKDHVHKDGKKIGTTLLAAAITNHPFLEGMSALSLYNCDSMPLFDFSKPETQLVSAHEALNLTDTGTAAGQRVMVAPGNARTQDEIGATFEIAEVVGDGDDAFVSIKDANGMIHKWFRATELLPASSTPANPQHPGLVPGAMPTVPVQPMGAGVPGQMGIAPAINPMAVVNPLAPGIPPTDPVAQAAASGVPNPMAAAATAKAAGAEKADDGDTAKSNEGATGAEGAEGAEDDKKANPFAKKADGEDDDDAKAAKKKKTGKEPGSIVAQTPNAAAAVNTDDLQLPDELKKALAAAMAAANPQKGMHMKFQLNNDKGEPVEITSEQLEAAGVKIVPEGSVAVPTTELAGMKDQVTSLSSRLDASEKLRVATDFEAEIKRLKEGALITGAQEGFARATWGGSLDLSAFRAWAATFTTPIVSLNKEHGSGGKPETTKTNGEEATEKLINLSSKIAREEGLSARDAMIKASAQLPVEAEAYRNQFADA